MNRETDILCEKAIKFLAEHISYAEQNSRKPRLMHAMRVGMYLYERKYDNEVVVAGFLHDTIEWDGVSAGVIKDAFGENIMSIVLANTKDRDAENIIIDMIKRCITCGKNALIVKTADIIDSFNWYTAQNNTEELTQHCLRTAQVIMQYKPENWQGDVFEELMKWQEKYKNLS